MSAQTPSPGVDLETVEMYAELKLEMYKGVYTGVFFTGENTKLTNEKHELLKKRDEVLDNLSCEERTFYGGVLCEEWNMFAAFVSTPQ